MKEKIQPRAFIVVSAGKKCIRWIGKVEIFRTGYVECFQKDTAIEVVSSCQVSGSGVI